MKVLVVGSGGREHALVWKIVQSPRVEKVYCAPGNGGISAIAECVPIKAMDIEGIVNFSKEKKIDMVVVAPDDPLAPVWLMLLRKRESERLDKQAAAVIESSKAFAKNLMKKYNIPTARYEIFENSADAINYLQIRNIRWL